MKRIRFGLIGCGTISAKHIAVLKDLCNEAELVAVCDIDAARLQKVAENTGARAYPSHREMLAQEQLDVVDILTWSGNHVDIARECGGLVPNIVVEKPMALRLRDADVLIEACDRSRTRLFVVKQNRYNPPVVALKKAVDAGRFGRLILGTARVRWSRLPEYYRKDTWRGTWAMDGGVLSNQASHHIDLLTWIFGQVESVFAKTGTFLAPIEAEDTGIVLVKFKSGALGIVEATTCARPKDLEGSISVLGEKGTVEIGGFAVNEMKTWQFTDKQPGDDAMVDRSNFPPDVYGYGHLQFMKEVIQCIREDRPSMSDGFEGRRSVEIINAIYESVERRQEVIVSCSLQEHRLGDEANTWRNRPWQPPTESLRGNREKTPLVDLSVPHKKVGPAILAAIDQLVSDSDFIGGKRLNDFESNFAAFTGARFAIGVSSGTAALALALKANGIGAGDEVITVAHTFIATAEAIIDAGAIPVFVDVDPVSGLLTTDNVRAKLTGKTRAVLPVHLYGHPVDLSALSQFCSERGLKLIQDSSQAHGALWDGMPLSAFGEAQTYSFHPCKNLGAWGDAGAIVSNDEAIAERLFSLRDHGRRSGEKYLHQDIGGNHRMDPIQAVVLSHKLTELGAGNARRRELFGAYTECLTGIDDVSIVAPLEKGTAVHHLLVIRSKAREDLRRLLKERGIATGIHYPVPVHKQPAFASFAGLSLPNTERLCLEVLSLPFYPELTQEQMFGVCNALREFCREENHDRPFYLR